MKYNVSKQSFQNLERAIFDHIKRRDPKMKLVNQRIEARQYTRFILERFFAGKSNFNRVSKNSAEQLKNLVSACSKMVSLVESLSDESRAHISIGYLISNSSDFDLDGFEWLRGFMYQAEEIITSAQPARKAKSRPKEHEKLEFLEAVVLVFEKAIGLQISEFDKLSVKERRKLKTGIYKLLECAQFGTSWFQSQDAAKKMMDRYIADGRPFQDDVLMSYKNFIKDELNHM